MDDALLVEVVTGPIDLPRVITYATIPSCGGISIFLGTTRDFYAGKTVLRLIYEAYESMALRQMREIAESAVTKWSLGKCAVVHRLGQVEVGEVSVVIACSAVHRDAALQATSEVIDAIKASVVIWKQEVYAEGPSVWKANQEWQFSHLRSI